MSTEPKPPLPSATGSPGDQHATRDELDPIKLSPRKALLNAAIVSLEYARQYLDKFLHWPDYILATHYYANVLALTDKKENKKEAERFFRDVESWLEPAGKPRPFDEARKRIRAEAIYNRAVLLLNEGNNAEEARRQLQSVINLVGESADQPLRGVRFAAEFVLLLLDLEKQGQTTVDRPIAGAGKDVGESYLDFSRKLELEIKSVEDDMDSAVAQERSLEAQIDEARMASSIQVKSLDAPKRAKYASDIAKRLAEVRASITKASKDLAILRMMESRLGG
jgi:hypothetical protein